MILDAAQLTGFCVCHQDLAGLHVPQQSGTGGIQCTALAGKYVAAAGQGADAQGPVAAGVTHCNELGSGHDHQTVGAFQHVHRLADGGLDAAHAQAVAGDQVADHLGIGGAVEDGTSFSSWRRSSMALVRLPLWHSAMVPRRAGRSWVVHWRAHGCLP